MSANRVNESNCFMRINIDQTMLVKTKTNNTNTSIYCLFGNMKNNFLIKMSNFTKQNALGN